MESPRRILGIDSADGGAAHVVAVAGWSFHRAVLESGDGGRLMPGIRGRAGYERVEAAILRVTTHFFAGNSILK